MPHPCEFRSSNLIEVALLSRSDDLFAEFDRADVERLITHSPTGAMSQMNQAVCGDR